MKKYSVTVLFLLLHLKVSSCFGISSEKKENWSHFRSSTFILQTRPSRARLDPNSSLVCACVCLADSECVGFQAVIVDKQCSMINTPVGLVGDIWKRYPVKTIGAFVLHKHKAYVSIGMNISLINLLTPRPKYEYITTSRITDTQLFHDVIQNKSLLFWPSTKLNLIERINSDTRTELEPLKTTTRLQTNNIICMTIDRNIHVIYVLSTDGTLTRLKEIGETPKASKPELVLRLPIYGFPGQRLMHRGNFLYITSPNKVSVDVVDLEKRKFLPNAVSWGCSSSPPDVVSIME